MWYDSFPIRKHSAIVRAVWSFIRQFLGTDFSSMTKEKQKFCSHQAQSPRSRSRLREDATRRHRCRTPSCARRRRRRGRRDRPASPRWAATSAPTISATSSPGTRPKVRFDRLCLQGACSNPFQMCRDSFLFSVMDWSQPRIRAKWSCLAGSLSHLNSTIPSFKPFLASIYIGCSRDQNQNILLSASKELVLFCTVVIPSQISCCICRSTWR